MTDGGRGVLTGVILVRESGLESQPTPTDSMSNVECGNSNSKSELNKFELSDDCVQNSDEFGLLLGDTTDTKDPGKPPGPLEPLGPALLPPPFNILDISGPPMLLTPCVICCSWRDEPPLLVLGIAKLEEEDEEGLALLDCPLSNNATSLSVRSVWMAIMKSGSFGLLLRNNLVWALTCTYTSGPPRRNRYDEI